jgi:Asp-tRNA(Asn)/Glu-tRNA(Gln) amidotransferase A subunit family amidase
MLSARTDSVQVHLIAITRPIIFLGCHSTGFPTGFRSEGLHLGAQLTGTPLHDHWALAVVHH